jgi:hypothetical protein
MYFTYKCFIRNKEKKNIFQCYLRNISLKTFYLGRQVLGESSLIPMEKRYGLILGPSKDHQQQSINPSSLHGASTCKK